MSKLIQAKPGEMASLWQAPSMDPASAREAIQAVADPPLEADENLTLRPLTADQLEQIEQAARDEGFRQGHTEGLAAGQAEIAEKSTRLGALLQALSRPLDDVGERVGDELVALTVAIARQLVRRELSVSPGEIVAVVREALQALPSYASDIRLELHPEDARLVRESMPQGDGEHAWRIIEDATLTRGGCRVRSDVSRVDASVEHRLSQIATKVLGDSRNDSDAEVS
ncbi:flagellar assembly protein FliH [Acidihalobacter aeolianus]|nr:flagellar assembly protein FliH [Acidihalobacter aeolianus]